LTVRDLVRSPPLRVIVNVATVGLWNSEMALRLTVMDTLGGRTVLMTTGTALASSVPSVAASVNTDILPLAPAGGVHVSVSPCITEMGKEETVLPLRASVPDAGALMRNVMA